MSAAKESSPREKRRNHVTPDDKSLQSTLHSMPQMGRFSIRSDGLLLE